MSLRTTKRGNRVGVRWWTIQPRDPRGWLEAAIEDARGRLFGSERLLFLDGWSEHVSRESRETTRSLE